MGRNPGKPSIELTSDRRALLELLMKERGAALRPAAAIPRRPDGGPAPLSFAQQRLWFLDQLAPGNPFYNLPLAVRFPAWLNVPVLERSINELVRRHESLRTTFAAHEGIPSQQIAPELAVPLPVIDLRGVPPAERETEALRLATEEARKPFDLASGPLLRTTLLQSGEAGYIFLLTIHHIVSDGWSMQVFARELFELYQSFAAGQPSPLPELPIQYADYAVWQRETLQGEALEQPLRYWKRRLAGLPVLELPTDHTRPPISSFRGDQYDYELPPPLAAGLKSLSQAMGATLYMTLLAAFTAQLSRYTGQEDIVVGMPVAGRSRSELEGLIGFFVNTLVLRIDHSGDPTFRTLLERVKAATVDAQAHQEVPFEKLVEELKPERDLSRNPLCQVAFQLFNAPPGSGQANVSGSANASGTASSSGPASSSGAAILPVKRGGAVFDLVLTVWESGGGLTCRYEFSTDLFEAETIVRMAHHFQILLAGAVADPDRSISSQPLLTRAEHRQSLVTWNDTAARFPEDRPIHQHFEAWAAQRPEAVAAIFEGQRLSYGELNRRANRIAHYLRSLGAGPEVLVGLCVERSLDMVAGLLGILKAGSAFVPLDPNYPRQRLAFMLADSRLSLLLTQEALVERLPEHPATMVRLDADWETIAGCSEANPESGVQPDHLAYVIYTSGSTGQPKGVLLAHCWLVNVAQAQRDIFELDPDSRVLQFSSLSFDASVFETVMAFYNGAALCLGTADTLLPGPALIQMLEKNRVSIVTLPPSALAVLPQAPLPDLKTITVAGEACPAGLVDAWAPGRRFFNLYGPTEATIWSTYARCEPGTEAPPIGRPVPNTQVYVLDRHLNPAPVGVPGELYLGGVGLARGYLGRPALTAQTFIPNPFSDTPGERLYRTGDRARWLLDGQLEFLGRVDHQVKLRSYRIELGEIEAALRQHPAVREAVALAREDSPGEKRLVAYIVPQQAPGPTVTELRRHLKQGLPEYMLPAAFVMLEALPLNPSGKVDRRALPPPGAARPELESGYVAPRTPVEEALSEIWKKVLGLKGVGVQDNFFDLGGDSILSIQIVTRANQAGLRLTPRLLFQHQTIAELAQVTGTAPDIVAEQGLVEGTAPLTAIQRWFFEGALTNPHHFNQAMMVEVGAGLSPAALEGAVRGLLEHHDALRLRFTRQESGWRQEHAAPGELDVPFLHLDLGGLGEVEGTAEVERIAAEQQSSFDLSRGPLVRVVYFDRGPARSGRLLVVIHHLVVDTVSWGILLDDLLRLYGQSSRGEALRLPPKTTSFQYWAQRLEEHVRLGRLAEELDYWLALGDRRATPLPLDNPGGDNTYGDSRVVAAELTPEETQALLREVPKAFKTQVNEALLAALAQAFAGWTGERSLLVDLEGHGREPLFDEVDLTRTVGWFTGLFPVFLDLGEASGPVETLRSVQAQLRDVPNHGIGFGLLRYVSTDAQVVERMKKLPQAEVAFNYLGQFGTAQAEGQLPAAPLESRGLDYSPTAHRRHLLEINASISEGRLNLTWTYSSGLHRPSTIERLAEDFLGALRLIIASGQAPEAGGYSSADFPDVDLSQEKLATILSELGLTFDEDGDDEEQED